MPLRMRFNFRSTHVAVCFAIASTSACRTQAHPTAASTEGAAAPATGALQPAIDFDTRMHDFGLVNEGSTLRHVFRVKNEGPGALVVSEVATSCGCTAAALGITTIPPGGSGPLEVTMDSHGERGRGTRAITVQSNDPKHPTSTLEIAYDVERLLGFDRWFVRLAARARQKRVEQVWLTGDRVGEARPRIMSIDGGAFVTARIIEDRRSGQARKGVRLELRAGRPASAGGKLTLATGLPDPPELSLPFEYVVD